MKEKKHYFFSHDQSMVIMKERLLQYHKVFVNYTKLNDGKVVEYTYCSYDKTHIPNFKDVIYLGAGEFHHTRILEDYEADFKLK